MAEKKTSEKKTTEKKPVEKKTAEKKPAEKKTAEKKPAAKTKAKAKAEEKVKEAEVIKEEVKEEAKAEAEAVLHPTLQKKKERREAKAARKAANAVEEKKSRPNNLVLALMIFGVLIVMFAVSGGYNYFQKPANLEKYVEDTGGEEAYGNVMIDAYTVGKITAKGNSVEIDMTAEVEDEEVVKMLKEQYSGDEGTKNLEQIAASVLSNMVPNTRAFSGDASVKMTINKEEINSVKITYSQAKKIIKDLQKEAEEANVRRRLLAKQRGEEAGTKLLIPMFLMLVTVLIIVVMPAFMTMQF